MQPSSSDISSWVLSLLMNRRLHKRNYRGMLYNPTEKHVLDQETNYPIICHFSSCEHIIFFISQIWSFMVFHSTYFEMFYFLKSTQNSFTDVLSHFCFSNKQVWGLQASDGWKCSGTSLLDPEHLLRVRDLHSPIRGCKSGGPGDCPAISKTSLAHLSSLETRMGWVLRSKW